MPLPMLPAGSDAKSSDFDAPGAILPMVPLR